jgi:hypothetical protein
MDNNFNSYTLLELKRMINHYKDFHTIKYTHNYRHLKKKDIFELLEKRFIIKNDTLYLKLDILPKEPVALIRNEKRRKKTLLNKYGKPFVDLIPDSEDDKEE